MEKYGDLLNSECEVKYDPSGRNTDVVVVDYPRGSKGAQLAYAVAGYISGHEYEKLFRIVPAHLRRMPRTPDNCQH